MDDNKNKIDETEGVLQNLKTRTANLKQRHDATTAAIDDLNTEIKRALDTENQRDNDK